MGGGSLHRADADLGADGRRRRRTAAAAADGRTDGRTAIHAPQMHAPQTLIHSPQPSDALNHLPNPNPKKVYARAPAKAILWVGGHYIGRTRTSARTDGGGGGRRRRTDGIPIIYQ